MSHQCEVSVTPSISCNYEKEPLSDTRFILVPITKNWLKLLKMQCANPDFELKFEKYHKVNKL